MKKCAKYIHEHFRSQKNFLKSIWYQVTSAVLVTRCRIDGKEAKDGRSRYGRPDYRTDSLVWSGGEREGVVESCNPDRLLSELRRATRGRYALVRFGLLRRLGVEAKTALTDFWP